MDTRSPHRLTRRPAIVLGIFVTLLVVLAYALPARANTVIVTTCTGQGLADAMNTLNGTANGGLISFDCDGVHAPATIDILQAGGFNVTLMSSYTIDGGNVITLTGSNHNRLIFVASGATLTLTNILLTDGNAGAAYGGAIYVNGGALILNNVTIQNSQTAIGYAGGAISNNNGSVTLINSRLLNNVAPFGAGVDSVGTLTIVNSELANNIANPGQGGALDVGGTVVISNTLIQSNTASSGGGGLNITGASQVTIVRSTFDANHDLGGNLNHGGGAILNGGVLTITESTFTNNHAIKCGGALDTYNVVMANGSTFEANSTSNCGGAIVAAGQATLLNSTLSGNFAQLGGGGLNTHAPGTITLTQVTLSNTATNLAQNLFADSSTSIRLKGSILTKAGAAGDNCYQLGFGLIVSQGYNVIDDLSCNVTGVGDHTNTDPQLAPLADNGGPTRTHLPLAGSPAIDSNFNADCPNTDQRGYVRPINLYCDSGAVEVNSAPPTPEVSPIVISQIYGGGGNANAPYTHDYIELFNRGDTVIDLMGWSVQYASANSSNWQATSLTGLIQPGHYFLIQEAPGGGGGTSLPIPDFIGTLMIGQSSGKVALVNRTRLLDIANPVGWPYVKDFVGYGAANGYEGSAPASGPSNASAAERLNRGCYDTNDNFLNFTALAPLPRNSLDDAVDCSTLPPPPTFTPTPTPMPTDTPTPEPTATVRPPDAPPPTYIPADLPGSVKPSISVNPNHGYVGQPLTVSGGGANGYAQVSIAWVFNGQTLNALEAAVDGTGHYSAPVSVHSALPVGAAQLCASVVGAPNGGLACIDVMIDAPPAGSVQGTIPIVAGQPINANFNLMNTAGQVIYSAPINASGQFNLPSVLPNLYRYSVTGQVPQPIAMGTASIQSQLNTFALVTTHCDTPAGASPSRVQNGLKYTMNTAFPLTQQVVRPFGLYFSGVNNPVKFTVAPQVGSGEVVQKVVFKFFNRNTQQVGATVEDATAPYQTTFDVGQLAPSSGNNHPYLMTSVIVGGVERCWTIYDIEVLQNPFTQPYIQPAPNSQMGWDAGANVYRFKGVIPYVPGVLPAQQTLPPNDWPELPYFKRFDNRLNAGVEVEGWVDLEGRARVDVIRAIAYAKVLNRTLFNETVDLIRPHAEFNINDLSTLGIPYASANDPINLVPYYYVETPFVTVPVITFFGLIDVTVNGGAGAGVGVTLWGTVRPFKPAVENHITGKGDASITLGVGVRALAGVASAGASARASASVKVPLVVILSSDPDIYFDPVCANFKVSVKAWADLLWGLSSKETTEDLVNWSGCLGQKTANAPTDELPAPDLIAAPSVASASDGRVLSAYVENTSIVSGTPQIQVLARFKNLVSGEWGAPIALSDPTHTAHNPVVAFIGASETPLIAWVENTLTQSKATTLGDNVNAHIQHQDIFYSLFDGAQWSTPVRLTDDLVPDGLPALIGSADGAVLAWTRDLDGDLATRIDQRVAVALFDPNTQTFGEWQLLSGAYGGMNNDVSVAYDSSVNPAAPYVAWTSDADGDLKTADDRRIAVASYLNGAWSLVNTDALPVRADSPAISVDANGIQLAFLVREAAGDETSVPLIGFNGALWTARYQNDSWSPTPLLDEQGQAVHAEQPVLAHGSSETLLLFRRFGEADTNGGLGQLSVSQIIGANAPGAPLYITDEPLQNWQHAISISPLDQQVTIVKVESNFNGAKARSSKRQSIVAKQAIALPRIKTLSTANDPVQSLTLNATADPALDPLVVSSPAPEPGSTLIVQATVRNVGRASANDMTINLYNGTPETGTLLDSVNVSRTLAFNATAQVPFSITAPSGVVSLTAEVSTTGQNESTSNDRASVTIGQLTAPAPPQATPSTAWDTALDLTWSSQPDEFVSGYRILRGTSLTDTFAFIGEAGPTLFTDTDVQRGQQYCYKVQAYNTSNVVSPPSAATCASVDNPKIYLPLVMKSP